METSVETFEHKVRRAATKFGVLWPYLVPRGGDLGGRRLLHRGHWLNDGSVVFRSEVVSLKTWVYQYLCYTYDCKRSSPRPFLLLHPSLNLPPPLREFSLARRRLRSHCGCFWAPPRKETTTCSISTAAGNLRLNSTVRVPISRLMAYWGNTLQFEAWKASKMVSWGPWLRNGTWCFYSDEC